MDDNQWTLVADKTGDLLAGAVRDAQDEPVVARPHADRGNKIETAFHLVHHLLWMAMPGREKRAGSVNRGGQA
jgi:hypothetical protein